MTRYAIAARWAMPMIVRTSSSTSWGGVMPTIAPMPGSVGISAAATMAPTAATLTTDLPPSTSAFGPMICLKPLIGFSRLGSGAAALSDGLKPTCTTLATTPATRQAPATGAMALPVSVSAPISRSFRPLPPTTSGVEMRDSVSIICCCM